MRFTAIVLAAGRGSRMNSSIQKQYMSLQGKPVLYYSLKAFENSFVDRVILVTGKEEVSYCKEEIVEKYGFTKVTAIVEGGRERYHSVYAGILAAGTKSVAYEGKADVSKDTLEAEDEEEFLLIHDGARPFLDADILMRAKKELTLNGNKAAVAAVPSKDTVKIADEHGYVVSTPERRFVWNMQTPQCFSFPLIRSAYETLLANEEELKAKGVSVTDDAMVVETFTDCPVKLFEGSYHNLKITTPEDLQIAEQYLKENICG